MPDIDVAVVGGAPGGAATAIRCAAAGLRVVLLEGAPVGRDRPGETLHPGVEPILADLGVAAEVERAGFPRHAGHWVDWEGPRRFEPFGADESGPWLGFQAWRADFDALLLRRATALGVEVRQPCRALAPLLRDGRVCGVATPDGPVEAPFVVDAAGGRHWLARHLELGTERCSPPLIAWYGHAEGSCPERDDAPALVADRQGWTWTARVRPEVYAWTRLVPGGSRLEAGWLPEELRGLQPRGRSRGEDVTWRLASPTAGPGYFLVGDAAAVLDPASSHGILKALMSGMLAAHHLLATLRHGFPEPLAAEAYSHWVGDWFRHDVERLRELYYASPLTLRPGRACPG